MLAGRLPCHLPEPSLPIFPKLLKPLPCCQRKPCTGIMKQQRRLRVCYFLAPSSEKAPATYSHVTGAIPCRPSSGKICSAGRLDFYIGCVSRGTCRGGRKFCWNSVQTPLCESCMARKQVQRSGGGHPRPLSEGRVIRGTRYACLCHIFLCQLVPENVEKSGSPPAGNQARIASTT